MRSTHTFAELELSPEAYEEIASKLRKAGYDHAFMENGAIDMHGIGITKDPNPGFDPSTERSQSLGLFLKLCEGRIVHDRLGDSHISPAGEPYVSLTGAGSTLEAMIAFRLYADTRPKDGTLYWRTLPEVKPGGGWFMRLCIA